jgi:hypothetical protein
LYSAELLQIANIQVVSSLLVVKLSLVVNRQVVQPLELPFLVMRLLAVVLKLDM